MAVLIGAASVPSRRALSGAFGALAALLLLLAGPGVTSARAHSALRETVPAEGSAVTSPTEVRMRFNEAVNPQIVDVIVTGADGVDHGSGPPRATGDLVVQPVSGLPAGGTVVAFRVVSADGHPVSGQWSFTVAAADPTPTAGSSPATAAPTADAGDSGTGAPGASEESGSDSSMVPVLVSLATIPLMVVLLTLLVRRVLRDSGRAGPNGPHNGPLKGTAGP